MIDNCRRTSSLRRLAAISGGLVVMAVATYGAVTMAESNPGIGIASVAVRDVEGKIGADSRRLTRRDTVYRRQVVETGTASASELRLIDNTQISLGPNSSLMLYEFVHDPAGGAQAFTVKLTEGVFRFDFGDMAAADYRVETPSAVIVAHGAIELVARGDGTVAVIAKSNEGVRFISNFGETVLLNSNGQAAVATADGAISSAGAPPLWALQDIRGMEQAMANARPDDLPEQNNGSQSEPSPTGSAAAGATADPDPGQGAGKDGEGDGGTGNGSNGDSGNGSDDGSSGNGPDKGAGGPGNSSDAPGHNKDDGGGGRRQERARQG